MMKSNIFTKICTLFFSVMAVLSPFQNSAQIYAAENNKLSNHCQCLKKVAIGTGCGVLSMAAIAIGGHIYKNSDNFFQSYVIGSYLNPPSPDLLKDVDFEDIDFTEINIDNKLRGYEYKAKSGTVSDCLKGKYVIFYSGSGCSNTMQISEVLGFYTSKGATVIGVDYHGFGKGDEKVPRGKVRQSSIYSDAEKIYKYVVNHYHVKNSNILLHGYSLGGPVAAHVAATFSNKDNKFCGLILQSSMKNTLNAAYTVLTRQDRGLCMRILGSAAGYLFADSFDCEKELKKLYQKDPGIKISVCGGNENDHLNLQLTKLDVFLKNYGFKNIISYNGPFSHSSKFCSAPRANFVFT